MVAGIVLLACPQAARPPATTGPGGAGAGNGGTGGGDGTPTAPAPQPAAPAEKNWTIGAADFGDDETGLTGAVSSRSAPFAWDGITGAEGEKVTVSIGGHELPFTSKATAPVFENDLTGAEWTVAAEVRAGAVALVLTAPDQVVVGDTVESVTITSPGSGYAADPTVSFAGPPGGRGTRAYGTAVKGSSVDSVTITTEGSGYTAVPTVTLGPPPSGTTATGAAVGKGTVHSFTVTNPGSGYRWPSPGNPGQLVVDAPAVHFPQPAAWAILPYGNTGAQGRAVLQTGVKSITITNSGSGYTSAPSVSFIGGGGSGAAATATLLNGRVVDVTMTNRGSGYTNVPLIAFSAAPIQSQTARGTAVVQSGVASVTIDNPGSGYTATPTIWFQAPHDGTAATGTVEMRYGVASVTITDGGSGYTSGAPTVTFSAAPSGGTTAAGTAVIQSWVTSVEVTNGGSGYTSAPRVSFSRPPTGAGNTRATGRANLVESGNDQYQNLYWARQTLAGKQLLVQRADQAPAGPAAGVASVARPSLPIARE